MSESTRGPSEHGEEPIEPLRLSTGTGPSIEKSPEDAPHLDPYFAERQQAGRRATARAHLALNAYKILKVSLIAGAALAFAGYQGVKLYIRETAPAIGPSSAPAASSAPIASTPIVIVVPDPVPPVIVVPVPSGSAPAGERVPKATTTTQIGRVPVVDLGTQDTRTLEESLRTQRAAAAAEHRTLLVMLVRYDNAEHLDVERAMADPRMQEALADARIVRADARFYRKELAELGFPTVIVPTLCLVGPDLVPRDAIDGREWDDDTPANMAPVFSAFLHGTYKKRRHPWTPPPSRGVQL